MRLLAVPLLFAVALLAHAGDAVSYGEAFEDGPAMPVSEAIAHFDHVAGPQGRVVGVIVPTAAVGQGRDDLGAACVGSRRDESADGDGLVMRAEPDAASRASLWPW